MELGQVSGQSTFLLGRLDSKSPKAETLEEGLGFVQHPEPFAGTVYRWSLCLALCFNEQSSPNRRSTLHDGLEL